MTFKDYFMSEIQVERPIGVLMRFNVRRVEYPLSKYIFVEGKHLRPASIASLKYFSIYSSNCLLFL